jgi:uncharacterized membrane protein YdbT with pleckstrin-like domain
MAEPIHPVEQAVKLLEDFIRNPPSMNMQNQRPYAYSRELRKHTTAKAAVAVLYTCNDWNFIDTKDEVD